MITAVTHGCGIQITCILQGSSVHRSCQHLCSIYEATTRSMLLLRLVEEVVDRSAPSGGSSCSRCCRASGRGRVISRRHSCGSIFIQHARNAAGALMKHLWRQEAERQPRKLAFIGWTLPLRAEVPPWHQRHLYCCLLFSI